MASPSYPPPASKTRSSKHHGHHRSSSSNANTLINAGEQPITQDAIIHDTASRTLSPPPPPSSYPRVESGRKGNHRAKRSSFSMTGTLVEPQPPIPLAQHDRSKSGSSVSKTQEDSPQLRSRPVSTGGKPPRPQAYANPPPQIPRKEHTCCGVVQESVDRAREDRYGPNAGLKPQPWIVLKLMVAITAGLMGYAGYVYIGVLVVPMLQEKGSAQGSRREGIGLLVGFGILYLWMVWAYFKIVTTSPGYAKDHVPLSQRPPCVNASGPSPRHSQTLSFPAASHHRRSQDSRNTLGANYDGTNNIGGPSYEQLSEMLAAAPATARRPSLDATGAMTSGGPPSKPRKIPEPLSTRGISADGDSLTALRPSPVDRTTSTMTVKSMSMTTGSKRTGSSPVALRFNEGEMMSGSPARERGQDDETQWESEATDESRDRRRGDGGELSSREGRVKGGRLVADSDASLSLKNVLREDGAAPARDESTMDLESGAAVGSHKLKRRRGLSGSLATSPLKWLFCCCWWLASGEAGDKQSGGKHKSAKPRQYISRHPPFTAVLDPYNRYCEKDGFVKPYRAHHCRQCGTCVLRFDHHCPWIGQCVGARNHKFFLNFCQAAFVCCSYILGSMVPYTHKAFNDPRLGINAQQVVIIALAGVFALFTFTLMASHVYMTFLGQTTVENMQIQTLRERENEMLGKAYRWYEFRGKLKTIKDWDREWGDWDKEGNIWWIGPRRAEWEAVMGTNPLGWILPIGKSPGDGLDYPVNPRFEPGSGRRRRRDEWPEGLR